MSRWFKKKHTNVVSTANINVEKQAQEDKQKRESSQDKDTSSFRYWIDIAGRIDNHLILKGWCVNDYKHVSIFISSSDGTSAHLINTKREQRNDVLSHLNLNETTLKPGFFKAYDIEHAKGDFIITFKTEDQEFSIPLTETESNKERLISAWMELCDVEQNSDVDDTNINLTGTATVIEECNDLEDELVSPIKHHIEKVGIYGNRTLLVRGWCLDIESQESLTISVTKKEKPLRILKYIRRNRQDVGISFGLDSNPIDYGFLLLVELASTVDKDFTLTFSNSTSTKKLEIQKLDAICKEELQQNLVDTDLFSPASAKLFLMETLGRTYISDIEKSFHDLKALNTNMHIDAGYRLKSGCFIRGWIDDLNSNLEILCFTDGTKVTPNLLSRLARKIRPDVNNAFEHLPDNYEGGFFCYGELGEYKEPISLLVVDKQGRVSRTVLDLKEINQNEINATQHILADIDPWSSNTHKIFEQHISPALLSIWEERTTLPAPNDVEVIEYGAKNTDSPSCSIIVPLYGRNDFVLHQISQFQSDKDFQNIDLIYVIDDPKIVNSTKKMCEDISKLYNVPFKVVSCGRNLGFAGANNLGALFAQSEYLLLLNSDVIPASSGWLARLLEQYQTTPEIGALGVKLVYEDESIQHVGMQFVQSREFNNIWLNDHPYKGFPEHLVPKIEYDVCATVTAACLLIKKDIFDQVGGFDTNYILGDFEDSDLCLKLINSGYKNYILGTEKLYHLERQSQSLVEQGDWKFKLTLFNGWQHTNRWDQLIKRLQA